MNRLGQETSPYLRQHAENPVDWWPWGPDAFDEARRRDVPVLLSVGYSACHWCHVMAHESFEDDATAALMNDGFVNVKVDREERPDVDAIYMAATQATTGHGGWPMTVFMTADGEPFHCGTYYPREPRGSGPTFVELLQAVRDAWHEHRDELGEQARTLTEHLRAVPVLAADDEHTGLQRVDEACAALLRSHDAEHGGFGRAPKFPQSMSIDLLLRSHRRRSASADESVELAAALLTLDSMAAGGVYDHLGGGFARYSTDDRWQIPHFEKMLYDNALLIRPYLHAWQLTGAPRHLQVVTETIEYVRRDLTAPGGGFCSAEDADSETVDGRSGEGWFSTWTIADVIEALGDDAPTLIDWYHLTERGNFEGRNLPIRPIGRIERTAEVERLRQRLFAARQQRPRPGLDDKVLTEWNALMIASLAEAGAATANDEWIVCAVDALDFLCRELKRPDGRWLRSWQHGAGARHLAYAHDYAALVDACTRVAEATGAQRWLSEAEHAADELIRLFWDHDTSSLFTTGIDADPLVTRPEDLMDGATPAAISTAALALPRLAALADRADLAGISDRILDRLGPSASRTPLGFAQLLAAVEQRDVGIREVVVVGDRPDLVATVRATWRPDVVLAWGEPSGRALWEQREPGFAYVCRAQTCLMPAASVTELEAHLEAR